MGASLAKALQHPEDEKILRKVFNSYDKNNDGQLSKVEFGQVIHDA